MIHSIYIDIFSAFYNTSQPNFVILLNLVCSFYSVGDLFAFPCLVLKLIIIKISHNSRIFLEWITRWVDLSLRQHQLAIFIIKP
jgi:hypothetical protein